MALYPRRVTSTTSQVGIVGTTPAGWVTNPSTYKGNQTFTTLAGVVSSIGSAGGWAYLPNTTLRSIYKTAAQLDAIAPRGIYRQDQITSDTNNQHNVWQTAAWNGYGFWYQGAGGHRTGYVNDLLMLRVADPVGVYRIYEPVPPVALIRNNQPNNPAGVGVGCYIDPVWWPQYGIGEAAPVFEWAPHPEHHYNGWKWDATRERLITGGDAQWIVTDTVYTHGALATQACAISVFNPYANSPREAWTRIQAPAGYSSVNRNFGSGVQNADGTWSFRSFGQDYTTCKINLSNGTMVTPSGTVGPANNAGFGATWRDPATNIYYEITGVSTSSYGWLKNLNTGATVANLPCWLGDTPNWQDNHPAGLIINGYLYLIHEAQPGVTATGTIYINCLRVNLSTGTIDTFGTMHTVTGTTVGSNRVGNGFHDRIGYVAELNCFVFHVDILRDALVFRPPDSWNVGGAWTPSRDGNGNIVNWASLPLQTWTEIPGSKFISTIKPILDQNGYNIYRFGDSKVGSIINNFTGMAWDFAGGRGWASGGGHFGGSDNGIYKLDINKMQWSVEAWPSKAGVDGFTAEDEAFYGNVVSLPVAWEVARNTPGMKRAYSRSSTGYAVRWDGTYSILGWKECQGPAGYLIDEAEYNAIIADPVIHTPFEPAPDAIYDIMHDGRPTSRHFYGGQCYSTSRQELIYVVRAIWRSKVDGVGANPGSGWVRYQNGGRTVLDRYAGEMIWVEFDDQTNTLYKGGCGSDCYFYGWYYYANGVKINLTTLAQTDVRLIPDNADTTYIRSGESLISWKAGRYIGAFNLNGYGWRYNLDTGVRDGLYTLGTGYSGHVGEGKSYAYIPTQGKLWVFDTNSSTLPCWEYDIDAPTPGGPTVGCPTLYVAARVKTLANSSALPIAGNGLVYNRLTYDASRKIIIYVPFCDDVSSDPNVWVLRVE